MKNAEDIMIKIKSYDLRRFLKKSFLGASGPRFKFYEDYTMGGGERGERIYKILSRSKGLNCNKLKILDLGCGYGGTSIYFAKQGHAVYALDIDQNHIQGCSAWAKENNVTLFTVVSSAENISFSNANFDVVILQDLIEHVSSVEKAILEVSRVLKKNGLVYFTVPNRMSILNILSDPHFGYFGIILFPKKLERFYLNRIRKKTCGYEVTSYPSERHIQKEFLSVGIISKRLSLRYKMYDSTLIGSVRFKNIVRFINNYPFLRNFCKFRLIQFFLNIFGKFISRGWIFIGEKRG
ncbi:class I SAM-dependent methyltransferase [Candidatus Omnitrophota bacterium]